MNDDQDIIGRYLPPGRAVRYDGWDDGGPAYGIVVHCWIDEEIGAYDGYVAFFGDAMPMGKPIEPPYILRYASAGLRPLREP